MYGRSFNSRTPYGRFIAVSAGGGGGGSFQAAWARGSRILGGGIYSLLAAIVLTGLQHV